MKFHSIDPGCFGIPKVAMSTHVFVFKDFFGERGAAGAREVVM